MNRLGELLELFIALAFVVACHVIKNNEADSLPLYDKQQNIIRSSDKQRLRIMPSEYPNFSTTAFIETADKHSFFTPTIYSPHFSLVTLALP